MAEYTKYATEARETLVQAAKQWLEVQAKAMDVAHELQTAIAKPYPWAAELVEVNHKLAGQVLRLQKDVTLGWVEALSASPAD